MFLSNSTFGVVASSSPQIVVIDQGQRRTVEVIDSDGYRSHEVCLHDSRQTCQTYSDQPLDLSIRKRNALKQNEDNGQEVGIKIKGCCSDLNLALESNSHTIGSYSDESDLSDIRITNVRSLDNTHLVTRVDALPWLRYGIPREESDKTFASDFRIMKRSSSDFDDHSDLNFIQKRPRSCSYPICPTRVGTSPGSIPGLRNGNEFLRDNSEVAPTLEFAEHPIPMKLFRSSEHGEMNFAMKSNLNYRSEGKREIMQTRTNRAPEYQKENQSKSSNGTSLESGTKQPPYQIISQGLYFDAHPDQRCGAPNTSSQNTTLDTPAPTSPVRFIPNRMRKGKGWKISSFLRNHGNTEKSSPEKSGRGKPLSDEYLVDLEVVKIHRRPYFQTEDSRELVEVRPRGLGDDGPTLLAYRALSGHIMIDWTAKSNYKAAEKIKELMPSSNFKGLRHGWHQEPGPAHTPSSTITAQHPRDVTLLVANGVVYKVSDA